MGEELLCQVPGGFAVLCAAVWNQGLATEGASEVLRYAFEELLLPEVVSFTVQDNLASRRVMEKIGMTRDLAGDFDHPACRKVTRCAGTCCIGRSRGKLAIRSRTLVTRRDATGTLLVAS
jgi:hypothetical protein